MKPQKTSPDHMNKDQHNLTPFSNYWKKPNYESQCGTSITEKDFSKIQEFEISKSSFGKRN
jgi:hypothetical protein